MWVWLQVFSIFPAQYSVSNYIAHAAARLVVTSRLKIYIPDEVRIDSRKKVIPPLYPLLNEEATFNTDTNKYGNWVSQVNVVNDPKEANIMLAAYYLEYYRSNQLIKELAEYHQQAIEAKILPVYFSSGDQTLTPPLKNYHLYMHGDYKKDASSNRILYPNFFPDPLTKYHNNILSYVYSKTMLPECGFCGQAYAGLEKKYFDLARILNQKIRKYFNAWNDDAPMFITAAYNRAKILEALQQSEKISSNFLIEKKYRAGAVSAEDKYVSSLRYFENIQQSLYIICYRGTGNFSIRFYETLAAGRIPVIIRSNDVLPFEDLIDWTVFPIVPENMIYNADEVIAAFHATHTADTLLALQQHARKLYEDFFAYKGFMQIFVNKYLDKVKK